MAKKTVLLQVDQRARDLVSVMLIGEYLQDMGVRVKYCNKVNMLSMALKHKPDVFVMSCSEGQYRELALAIAPSCKIVLMTQEGACATKESTILRHTLKGLDLPCYINGLSRVYLWGNLSKKWLLEDSVYPEEIIRVFGTSRLDAYLTASSRKAGADGRVRVGFANRGAAVNPARNDNPIWKLDQYRKPIGGHRAYVDDGREWEDWIWHSMASLRVNLDLVEQLSSDTSCDVLFRPDPYEKADSYEFLVKKYSNFSLNTDPVLFNFIDDLDILVTEFSTTGLEALLLKKPVISTQKLLGSRLKDHNSKPNHLNPEHMQFYWQPSTLEEFMGLIERFKKGDLPFSPEPDRVTRYLRDFYQWEKSSPSAAYQIAKDLKEIAETPKSPNLQKLHDSEYQEHPLVQKVADKLRVPKKVALGLLAQPRLPEFREIANAFKEGQLETHFQKEFYPWDLGEIRRVKKLFQKLKARDSTLTHNA